MPGSPRPAPGVDEMGRMPVGTRKEFQQHLVHDRCQKMAMKPSCENSCQGVTTAPGVCARCCCTSCLLLDCAFQLCPWNDICPMSSHLDLPISGHLAFLLPCSLTTPHCFSTLPSPPACSGPESYPRTPAWPHHSCPHWPARASCLTDRHQVHLAELWVMLKGPIMAFMSLS